MAPSQTLNKRERDKRHDRLRRIAKPWRNLYKLKAWLNARDTQLAVHPLCERCERRGYVKAAAVVNHRVPHRGDIWLFFDRGNHESLCADCHDGVVQQMERLGYSTEVDESGRYTDPMHPSNR